MWLCVQQGKGKGIANIRIHYLNKITRKAVVTDLNVVIPAVSHFLKWGYSVCCNICFFYFLCSLQRSYSCFIFLSGIDRYCLNFHLGYCLESPMLLFLYSLE